MKIGAIVCFVLAVLGTISALRTILVGGPNRPEGMESLVGYAVGAMLVPMTFLILGLYLWNRAKRVKGPSDSTTDSRS